MSKKGYDFCVALLEYLAADSGISSYSTTKFGKASKFYLGADENKPPAIGDMPFVMVYPRQVTEEEKEHAVREIAIGCAVKDESAQAAGVITLAYAGIGTIEEYEGVVFKAVQAFTALVANEYGIVGDSALSFGNYYPLFHSSRNISVITERNI